VRDAGGADVASDEVVVLPSGGAPSPLLTRPSPARSRCGGGPTQFWGSGLVGLVEPVAFFTFYLRSTPSARPRPAPSVAGSALLTAGSGPPVAGSTLPTTGPGPLVAGSVPPGVASPPPVVVPACVRSVAVVVRALGEVLGGAGES
jgi:hypothetical protein